MATRIKPPQPCKHCKVRARAEGSSRCGQCSKAHRQNIMLDNRLAQKIKNQIKK